MSDFIESLGIEATLAIIFGLIGIVSTKILSPFISFIVYKRTREYPNGNIKKILDSYDNLITRVLKKVWYKKRQGLATELYKYDVRIYQSNNSDQMNIVFNRNQIINLRINVLNLVTATLIYQQNNAGIYAKKEIDLIGYFRELGDAKILFLEEKENNIQAFRFEKSEFLLPEKSTERLIFGHSVRFNPEHKVIENYQTFLYPEKRSDLHDFINACPHKFNKKLIDLCTKENVITVST